MVCTLVQVEEGFGDMLWAGYIMGSHCKPTVDFVYY